MLEWRGLRRGQSRNMTSTSSLPGPGQRSSGGGRELGSRYPLQPLGLALLLIWASSEVGMANPEIYPLPAQEKGVEGSLTDLLHRRRTLRDFSPQPVSLAAVGQLLWAAQGINSPQGLRTAPSAGALYPLELHLIAGAVTGLPVGHYRYLPKGHALQFLGSGDLREQVARAALRQSWIAQAPALVVISAVEARTTGKYGQRGIRYVHMEVGHASQNLLLQAVALGLDTATVGAFDDAALKRLLALPEGEQPLVILPFGQSR